MKCYTLARKFYRIHAPWEIVITIFAGINTTATRLYQFFYVNNTLYCIRKTYLYTSLHLFLLVNFCCVSRLVVPLKYYIRLSLYFRGSLVRSSRPGCRELIWGLGHSESTNYNYAEDHLQCISCKRDSSSSQCRVAEAINNPVTIINVIVVTGGDCLRNMHWLDDESHLREMHWRWSSVS